MSDIPVYVAESAAWALAGFVGGFTLGRVVRDAYRQTGVTVTTHATGKRTWRPSAQWVLGVVVILLAVATVVQGIVESAATRAVVACQQQYSDAFAEALDARTTASNAAQNALDQLITTVGHSLSEPVSTPQRGAELQQAITAYLNSRAEVKAQQRQHPYPPAPRNLCQ